MGGSQLAAAAGRLYTPMTSSIGRQFVAVARRAPVERISTSRNVEMQLNGPQ
jgi:hypothetical protein